LLQSSRTPVKLEDPESQGTGFTGFPSLASTPGPRIERNCEFSGRVRRARFRQFSNRKDNAIGFGKRIHGHYQDLTQLLGGSISMDDAFKKLRRPSGHLLTEGKWPRVGIERSTSLQEPALTMRLAACMPHTVLFGDDRPFALGLLGKTGFY
jgi:hypothetical protein